MARLGIESSGADLVAITETGCNESIHNAELVPPGYQIIRCDRADGRKQGGAFLVATHGYELRKVTVPGDVDVNACAFELICATVYKNNRYCLCCCVVYIPPRSESEYTVLFNLIEQICLCIKKLLC
jgi:hypothetical protein